MNGVETDYVLSGTNSNDEKLIYIRPFESTAKKW